MQILNIREEADHIFLTIKSDEKSFESVYTSHFKGASKHIAVPGFRKGHAPLNMVISHIKNKGKLELEHEKIVNKLIDKTSGSLIENDEDLKEKMYALALDRKLNEFDPRKWAFVFEAKFEKVPEVSLDDYSSLSTLIEHKSHDVTKCPVTVDREATNKDLVSVSMLTKDPKGEIIYQYTYDIIEIDLENTKVRGEIVNAIVGSKAKDKKEITFIKDDTELKMEIIVLEVKEKRDISEELKKELRIAENISLDQMKEFMVQQHKIHNSSVGRQDIVKWLLSNKNVVKPLPIENLRFEASRLYRELIKRGKQKVSFEAVLFDHIKNFKSTMVLNEITKKEKLEFSDEDKGAFLKDVEEHPWLYGYKKPEDLFNIPDSDMEAYVLQFKALNLLLDRWTFSN